MSLIGRKQEAIAAGMEVYGRMLDLDDAHIADAVRAGMGAVFEAVEQQHAGAVSREHAVQAIGWLSAEFALNGAPELGPEWLELWDRALTATGGQ